MGFDTTPEIRYSTMIEPSPASLGISARLSNHTIHDKVHAEDLAGWGWLDTGLVVI